MKILMVLALALTFQISSAVTPQELIQKSQTLSNYLSYNAHSLTQFQLSKASSMLDRIMQDLGTVYNPGNPYPNPNPGPTPGNPYGQFSLKSIALKVKVGYSSEGKATSTRKALSMANDYSYSNILNACKQQTTWQSEDNCQKNFLQSAPDFQVDAYTAKEIIVQSCAAYNTWADELQCFQSSVNSTGSQNGINAVNACKNSSSYNSESAVRCIRTALFL
ncbi:MAG: hypothetical protein H6620_07600 [Halobacteriovoraceae bacterium]|nr:hypothetical protein [Halobacteriovoraceae bacterium]